MFAPAQTEASFIHSLTCPLSVSFTQVTPGIFTFLAKDSSIGYRGFFLRAFYRCTDDIERRVAGRQDGCAWCEVLLLDRFATWGCLTGFAVV